MASIWPTPVEAVATMIEMEGRYVSLRIVFLRGQEFSLLEHSADLSLNGVVCQEQIPDTRLSV